MFGPRLRIPLHDGLSESGDSVTLRPVEADEVEVFIGDGGGFQSLEVTGLLTGFRSNTLGDFRKLRTSAFHSNTASRKAIENAGFTQTGIGRNRRLFHGQYQHSIAYELPNPEQKYWDLWWGNDDVPDEFAISRAKSTMVLEIGRERTCW